MPGPNYPIPTQKPFLRFLLAANKTLPTAIKYYLDMADDLEAHTELIRTGGRFPALALLRNHLSDKLRHPMLPNLFKASPAGEEADLLLLDGAWVARNRLRRPWLEWVQQYYRSGLLIIPPRATYHPLRQVLNIAATRLSHKELAPIVVQDEPQVQWLKPYLEPSKARKTAGGFSPAAHRAQVTVTEKHLAAVNTTLNPDLIVTDSCPSPSLLSITLELGKPLLLRR